MQERLERFRYMRGSLLIKQTRISMLTKVKHL